MRRKIIGFILLLFFLGLLPILLYFGRKAAIFQPKASGSGKMILNGPTSPVNVTIPSFDVMVIVNTGGADIKSRGFDVSLNFPTDKLQLLDIVPIASGQTLTMFKTFTPVKLTPTPPATSPTYDFDKVAVMAKANAGQALEFSAIAVVKSSNAGYTIPVGAGTPTPVFVLVNPTPANNFVSGIAIQLVTLKFKPIAAGVASISFNFKVEPTPGWRNDSNISAFDVDTDLLSEAQPLNVTIVGAATNTPTKTPTPTATKTPTPTVTQIPCPRGDLGDINCDNLNNEIDGSLIILNWRTSLLTPAPAFKPGQKRSADVSGDGLIDEADFSKLLMNWKTQ